MKISKIIESRLFYSILPIIPILIILYITDSFYFDIECLKKDYNININQLHNQKILTIYSIINNRISQAKIQNHNIKLDLIRTLHNEYNNNNILIIKDLNKKEIPYKLYKTYLHVLNKDYENSKIYDVIEMDNVVFISNGRGVVEINDKTSAYRNILGYKSWDELIRKYYNKDLTKQSIDDILSMKDKTILLESKYATLTNYDISKNFDIKSPNLLSDIINKNDLLLFKNFNILVPTYITIVNSPDDIIIIREINLFNIIEPYMYSIYKYNEMVEDYKHDMNKLIFIKIMACITIASALLISFFLALLSAIEKIKETR